MRAHYARPDARAARAARSSCFSKLGLDHCVVRTDQPYIDPLRDLFARRARRIAAMKRGVSRCVRRRARCRRSRPQQAHGPTPAPRRATDAPAQALGESSQTLRGARARRARSARSSSRAFPQRGTSGHAATLELVVEHGKGETVLAERLSARSRAATRSRRSKRAASSLPDPDGGAGPSSSESRRRRAPKHACASSFVPLPPSRAATSSCCRRCRSRSPAPAASLDASARSRTRSSSKIRSRTRRTPSRSDEPASRARSARSGPPPSTRRSIALIALVVGALVAWLIGRWLRRPQAGPPPPPPRPPWEVALEELFDLEHAGLVKSERFAEHFDRVSDCVRKYLGDRYGFDGLESTTRETLAVLRAHRRRASRCSTRSSSSCAMPIS